MGMAMKKILALLALIALLAACAKQAPAPMEEGGAAAAWQDMLRSSGRAEEPYRIQLSMRFGQEGDTRRVTALLWGNSAEALRLDVMAGVGAVIAKISERGDDFLLYTPRDNRAFYHQGSTRPMLKIGVPVPFDLAQLAALLNGRFSAVFGSEPRSLAALPDGNVECALDGPLAGDLILGRNGAPLAWRQKTGGWRLEFSYGEEAPLLPAKLNLSNANGKRAIILVKERERVDKPFDERQMELKIPAGAPLAPLSQYKPA